MALADKIFGDVTLTFNDITSGTKAYANLIPGTVSVNVETPEDRAEFEDGSAADQEIGRRTILELDISDLTFADFDTIEGFQGDITLAVAKTSKTYTFPGTAGQPNYVITSMVDGKMHIKATCNWPVNTNMIAVLQVA